MGQNQKKKGLVLIVDDAKENLHILNTILKNNHYQTELAENGIQALEIVKDVPPDLILLDIMMPELDGFETCRRLKKSPETKDIPIIFLTAKTEIKDLVKGFHLGAVDYVTKPYNSTELLARVATHLELKFSRETIAKQNDERKELLHVLCHDLSNPFNSIKGYAHLVKKGRVTLDELLNSIDISIRNGLEIIDQIREMRVLEEKETHLRMDNYNLKTLIQESRDMLHSSIANKNLIVEVSIDDNWEVLVEKTSFINSVFNNILTNAIKFSFPASKIVINAGKKDDEIIVSVQDFGIGMSDTLLKNIFDLSKATTRAGTNGETGTGFGMPLVKKFITAYGGDIEIRSKEKTGREKNHGTEIRLKLKRSASRDESRS